MLTGLDSLVRSDFDIIGSARFAVLTHQAAVDVSGTHILQSLVARGMYPSLVFSPEHGLWSTHQDMESVDSTVDALFRFPVVSLYGRDAESLTPQRDLLEGVALLIVDLQDIGTRYYTFAATLARALRVAAMTGTRVVVLDRPDPIDGVTLEGGRPAPDLRSFVGELDVPIRHGLTMGELARFVVSTERLDVDLTVVPLEGWNRGMWPSGRPFVPPSPNMPAPVTALLYPGLCLLEGTNVSEGRGTTTPFEVFGAPWMDALAVAHSLRVENPSDGVQFMPMAFRPMFGKWAGYVCQGVRIGVTRPTEVRSLAIGVALLKTLMALHPADFAWRTETYEFETSRLAIDLLLGHHGARKAIEDQMPVFEVMSLLETGQSEFARCRSEWILYEPS